MHDCLDWLPRQVSFCIICISSSRSVAKCRRLTHDGLVSSLSLSLLQSLNRSWMCRHASRDPPLPVGFEVLHSQGRRLHAIKITISLLSSPQQASMEVLASLPTLTQAPACSVACTLHDMRFCDTRFCRLISVETMLLSSDASLAPILQFESLHGQVRSLLLGRHVSSLTSLFMNQ
jgi:hypothetical protein